MTDTIAYLTDLEADEEVALKTAVALASASGARLVSIHATQGAPPMPHQLGRAEEVAKQWGVPLAHEPMVHACCDDRVDGLLDALRRVEPVLVVSGTRRRSSFGRLLEGSVAEGVARNSKIPTLIVPLHGRGLADASTGALALRSLVVAAGDGAATRTGLLAAVSWRQRVGARGAEIVLAHVEDGTAAPPEELAEAGERVSIRRLSGGIEEALSRLTQQLEACMLVMATRGHDGLLDALQGSHTERVLHQVACPVLAVPIL